MYTLNELESAAVFNAALECTTEMYMVIDNRETEEITADVISEAMDTYGRAFREFKDFLEKAVNISIVDRNTAANIMDSLTLVSLAILNRLQREKSLEDALSETTAVLKDKKILA